MTNCISLRLSTRGTIQCVQFARKVFSITQWFGIKNSRACITHSLNITVKGKRANLPGPIKARTRGTSTHNERFKKIGLCSCLCNQSNDITWLIAMNRNDTRNCFTWRGICKLLAYEKRIYSRYCDCIFDPWKRTKSAYLLQQWFASYYYEPTDTENAIYIAICCFWSTLLPSNTHRPLAKVIY